MRNFLAAGAALWLTACGSPAEEATTTAPTSGEKMVLVDDGTAIPPPDGTLASDAVVQPTDTSTYLAMAGAADKWAIESSRLMAKKSARPDVRALAQMMTDQHGQMSAKIKSAAAREKAMVPTPTLAVDQQGMLSEIRTAPVQDVDAIYLRHQRAAHARTLALHQGFAAKGDSAELQKVAAALVPMIEQQIAEIDRVSRNVPATGG